VLVSTSFSFSYFSLLYVFCRCYVFLNYSIKQVFKVVSTFDHKKDLPTKITFKKYYVKPILLLFFYFMSFGTNMYTSKTISAFPRIIIIPKTIVMNGSSAKLTVPAPCPVPVIADTPSKNAFWNS